MSKISLLNQIKTFIASHLVPVITTSAVVVVGVTAGIAAIVVNNKQEIPNATETSEPTEEKETESKPNEVADNKTESDNKTTSSTNSDKSTTNTSNAEQTKPNTTQNQVSNNQPQNTQKPNTSSSSTSTTAPSKPNTTTQPSQPTTPTTPTQPTTPVEPEKPTVKTDYYYLCVGTTNDPTIKAEIQGGVSGAQDFMVYSFERKAPITNCLDELHKMSVPDVANKLSWKLREFNTFDELMRFEDNLFYGGN